MEVTVANAVGFTDGADLEEAFKPASGSFRSFAVKILATKSSPFAVTVVAVGAIAFIAKNSSSSFDFVIPSYSEFELESLVEEEQTETD